ncbi:hypothetical protein P5792_21810 [Bacillus toyonensis]|nr:hypothetical protein [Bacillus toyonensis]MDF9450372.1 hypothetical protein [Bacillus toyonensis]
MPISGESALMLVLSKIGSKFVLKELPILDSFGKLTYNKEKNLELLLVYLNTLRVALMG